MNTKQTICSMTAFARHEIKASWGTAVWEIRSVNQRYLESYFRLPEQQRILEPILREQLRKSLSRGKIECNLRIDHANHTDQQLQINEPLVKQLITAGQWIQHEMGEGTMSPLQILQWPGVLQAPETDLNLMNQQLLDGFQILLTHFIAVRQGEGASIEQMLRPRLEEIKNRISFISQRMPEIIQWQRDRLLQRFEEVKIELEPQRLEQEIVLLAQKVDVTEELDRLQAHIKETMNILTKAGACGRRLDFMMQEFNREANTLGSKSINHEITTASVDIKVLIEQMREQIQNIE